MHAKGPRRRSRCRRRSGKDGLVCCARTCIVCGRQGGAPSSERTYPPSSDAAVLSSSRTPMVTSLLRARYVMSGTLMLIAASSQPPRTHHPYPTPVLLTPLTREVVAGGCCRYIRSTSSAGARRLIRYHHPQRCPTLARASQPELSSCTRHGQARSTACRAQLNGAHQAWASQSCRLLSSVYIRTEAGFI
jgi:hypothetical protein